MSSPMHHPEVELVPTSALIPNPRNARKHSDRQIRQLATFIGQHGFRVPIGIDQHNVIVAGHGRWAAARQLKLDLVPVIRTHFLSEAERNAFALADNRLAELSSWDDDILKAELENLFEGGFDITGIGFSTADLDFSVVGEKPAKPQKAERVDLPDPQDEAVTRPGDCWDFRDPRSGRLLYRACCGDSRLPATYEAALGDERADIVFGDAPYNVKINGHVSGTGRHREFVMGAGEMSPPEFTHFLRSVFRNCVRFSRDGSIHYQCMDWRHAREILDAADGIYHEFKQLVVWNKTTGSMGSFYRSQHELVFVFKAGKAKHVNNFGLGETGRYRTNVVEYAGCNTFRKGREADLEAHSTVKPTALVADFLLDCSNRGDLVLDPFLGSGTTLLAAARTKRRGVGIELDPLYVDTAIRRLRTVTAIAPVLAGDGRSLDEIAAERLSGKED